MSEKEYDPYDLDEPTPYGAGVVTINSASFGYNAEYAGGEQELAIFEGSVIGDDGEAHDWNQVYSLGKGWTVLDGGSRVERADGRQKNFQKTSKYGLWLAGALKAGAGDTLRKRGNPMEAKIWEGLTFEVDGEKVNYGGEIGEKTVLVPVKFVGETGKASTATPAAVPAAPKAANGSVSGAMKAKLKKIATESDTHDAFIDRAFVEVDGVDGNKEIEALVADSPEFYESLRAS